MYISVFNTILPVLVCVSDDVSIIGSLIEKLLFQQGTEVVAETSARMSSMWSAGNNLTA